MNEETEHKTSLKGATRPARNPGFARGVANGLFDFSVRALQILEHVTRPKRGAPPRQFNPDDISLDEGYAIEPLVMNLSIPTTMIFDGGDILVAESGFVQTAQPRVLRIRPDWSVEEVAGAGLRGPVTGLLVHDGLVYISHRGQVSVVEPGGTLRDIVTGLPSWGDHQNNQIALGPDGKIYLGQGTYTNSGVVGVDSYLFGWLAEHPEGHDVPCRDVILTGQNFETENPLTSAHEKILTGAYQPYGTPTTPGQVVRGMTKCNGSILRFNPDGSELEVYASGLRNPFGLAFDRSGQLWATFHGADGRGSRPIADDPDYFIRVEQGAWYGWPEFFDGSPVTDDRFHEPLQPRPEFLWKEHPPLTPAFTTFAKNGASNGFAFSPGGRFGYTGDAFVAMFGAYVAVTTGLEFNVNGYNVVRVDMATGQVHPFAWNKLPGPAYVNRQHGFDRPADIVFGPDESMYIVDWGASKLAPAGLKLIPLTGAIWRVYREGTTPRRPQGSLVVEPAPQVPAAQRKPELKNAPELYQMYAPQIGILLGAVLLAAGALALAIRWLRRGKD